MEFNLSLVLMGVGMAALLIVMVLISGLVSLLTKIFK